MHKVLSKKLIHRNRSALPPIRCQQNVKISEKKEQKVLTNLKKYWFSRYVDYVKNYDLGKHFPKTIRTYRIFRDGIPKFLSDMIDFVLIKKKLTMEGMHTLMRDELQLLHTLPTDLIKISPLLLFSPIPFANYLLFPLAYRYPKHLLSSHFWTSQQKLEFTLMDHAKKLKHNVSLLRCMQEGSDRIADSTLKLEWNDIVGRLGSGTHPSVEQVIASAPLFTQSPYSLDSLKRKHVRELLAIHGMSQWKPFKRSRLKSRGIFTKRMDKAIQREGGVNKLSKEDVRWALFFRGINPVNMSSEDMENWLNRWLEVSNIIDENNLSLLLHCPILLGYNISTNWPLIYSYR